MEPIDSRTRSHHWLLYGIIIVLLCIDGYLNKVWADLCDESARVGSILGSHHPGAGNDDANEKQWPSLYAQCDGWTVGFYQNSYSSDSNQLSSTLIGYEMYFNEQGSAVEYSIIFGLVDGYPEKWKYDEEKDRVEISEKKWLPWVSLNLGVQLSENPKIPRAKVWVIPDPNEIGDVVVYGFGVEWRID